MNAPHTNAAGSAGTADVLAERQRQITAFGHDATADDQRPRTHLLRAAHVRLLDACDLVSGRAGQSDLKSARRRIVQAAALCLAELDRIDRQMITTPNEGDPL